MQKLNHNELEYFDKIFFEVVKATNLLSYLCAGKYSVDIFYDLYELTEERFELLIEEYEQNRMLGCC